MGNTPSEQKSISCMGNEEDQERKKEKEKTDEKESNNTIIEVACGGHLTCIAP
jgi:hypothetical protein